jgi:hypothetical protein
MTIATLAASMRHAFIERKGATIGGGKFTPEELKEGAAALAAVPLLVEALECILCHEVIENKARREAAVSALEQAGVMVV